MRPVEQRDGPEMPLQIVAHFAIVFTLASGTAPKPAAADTGSAIPGPILRAPAEDGVPMAAPEHRIRAAAVPVSTSSANTRAPAAAPAVQLPGSQHPLTTDEMQDLITKLVLENIPHEYEDRDDWEKTKEIVSGLNMKLDGLKLKTSRRRKQVNHGSWKMYGARLLDPENEFDIDVANMTAPQPGQISFTATFTAKMLAWARLQEWNLGTRLMSVSTEADVRLELAVDCLVAFEMDASEFPPTIVLHPQVTRANLDLKGFRVRRISHVKGSVARELGRSSRRVIEKQIKRKRDKLVSRINKQIKKNEDKLRLSFRDLLNSSWGKTVKPLLPSESASEE